MVKRRRTERRVGYSRGKRKRSTRGRIYRTSRRRPRVSLALKQHQFCERAKGGSISIGNEAGTTPAPYYTKVFKFRDLPQCDAYSKIFEQYRIDKVVATFRYKGISTPANLSGGPAWVNELNPMIYFKVDHNDVDANTLALMKLSTKTKTHMFTNDTPEFSITLKPAAQSLAISGSTGAITYTNVPEWRKWIDADGPTGPGTDVEHFGLKVYAVGYKSSDFDPGALDVEYKYYFSMKSNE